MPTKMFSIALLFLGVAAALADDELPVVNLAPEPPARAEPPRFPLQSKPQPSKLDGLLRPSANAVKARMWSDETGSSTHTELVVPPRYEPSSPSDSQGGVRRLEQTPSAIDSDEGAGLEAASDGWACGDACGCEECCVGCHGCHENDWGLWGYHCKSRFWPNCWCSPGDMPGHHGYVAEPKSYYYFRPYNWMHIALHQREVLLYGGDPRHPYDNRLFQRVYAELGICAPPAAPLVEPLAKSVEGAVEPPIESSDEPKFDESVEELPK